MTKDGSPGGFSVQHLRLIAITAAGDTGPDLIEKARAAVRGGATMLQLRMKHADPRSLVEVARTLVELLPVPVIVNDRADIAIAAGAAGVHVGADDVPVHAIRSFAPAGFIIGASVGCDAELANAALADYAGIGPAFGTVNKADAGEAIGAAEVSRLALLSGLPAVAIGGISESNVATLALAGIRGVAVVGAIFHSRDVEGAARAIRVVADSAFGA